MAKKAHKLKKYLNKKNVVIFAAVVLVVAGLTVYTVFFDKSNRTVDDADTDTATYINLPTSEELTERIDSEQSLMEKAILYTDLASAKQIDGKMDESLEAALKSIEIYPTHQGYAMAGGIYAWMGEKDQAIEMYNKAMGLTEKTENPNQVSFYNDYSREIMAIQEDR